MSSEVTWPQAPGGETLSPPLSVEDLRAFAGSQATVSPMMKPVDYYVPRWTSVLSEQSERGGFNWAAAFFGAYWCFWRKLYALAFVILLADLVSTLLVTFILLQGFDWQPTQETIGLQGWIAALPVRFLLGAHAKHALPRPRHPRRRGGTARPRRPRHPTPLPLAPGPHELARARRDHRNPPLPLRHQRRRGWGVTARPRQENP